MSTWIGLLLMGLAALALLIGDTQTVMGLEPREFASLAAGFGLVLLIALSASAFGAMAIFARFAYAAGADVYGLLAVRFVLAAIAMGVVVAWMCARGMVLLPMTLVAGGFEAAAGYAASRRHARSVSATTFT